MSLPGDAPSRVNFDQAVQHFVAGRLDQAAGMCRVILSTGFQHAPALHLLGITVAEQGRPTEGLRLVEQALELDGRNPAFHFSRGLILVRSGNPAAAIEAFKTSAQLNPGDPRIFRHLALALLACRRVSEADAVVRKALGTWPASAELLDCLGMVLMAQALPDGAREALERACEVAPDYPDAYGNLAILHEQHNRLDEALEVIKQGLSRWPSHRTLRFIQARCLRRRGEYSEAKPALQHLLKGEMTDKLHLDIEFELGWCADGMDEAAEALQHFTQANFIAEKLPSFNAAQGAGYLGMLTALEKQFDPDWVASWQDLPSPAEPHEPVFIIGFPRSGTTLLDTVLGAHPEFRVLEERPTVQAMLEYLTACAGGYPAGLATLTAQQQAAMRSAYFEAAGMDTGARSQQRLLDKSPFNTAHVGLIHRAFPEAQLVFVARHPCDVCLSCFMNNFDLNSGTQHFTRLETTVTLYCRMMALWLIYAETLPLHYKIIRYEDLVSQPETELRDLLDALGIAWSGSVLQHTAHAAKRGHIPTPSYAQVHRPIYHDARYRWRRYAHFLKPFLKDLQPYIETFGYAV
jgi:Flp pilus assembly protein TadD